MEANSSKGPLRKSKKTVEREIVLKDTGCKMLLKSDAVRENDSPNGYNSLPYISKRKKI